MYQLFITLFVALVLVVPEAAYAYIGPGASKSAQGTVLILGGLVLLAIVALLWYPLKRLFGRNKDSEDS
jgi:hypothetical protein